MNGTLGVLLVLRLAVDVDVSLVQAPGAAANTHVSAADLRSVLEAAKDKAAVDLNARIVPAGPNDVLVNIARRTEASVATDSGLAHGRLTEVYYVLEGAGVLVTGGTLTDPQAAAGGSDNVRGKGIVGGESRLLRAGDVVVIPPGTAHAFSSIDKAIVYLNVRIAPGRR